MYNHAFTTLINKWKAVKKRYGIIMNEMFYSHIMTEIPKERQKPVAYLGFEMVTWIEIPWKLGTFRKLRK